MRPRRILFPLLALVFFGQACGDDDPTGPGNADLEILILRGNDQYAEPGLPLPIPLEVRVQALSDGQGEEGVKVRWEIVEGSGAQLDRSSGLTDAFGETSAELTLGPGLGRYRVRASVAGMLSSPVEFEAQAILVPELTLVPDWAVRAGDTILLEGRNISPSPEENVVTFSRVRGRVISASPTSLRVEVPPCLPTRQVALRLQIGALGTPASTLSVTEGDQFFLMDVGEDRILDAANGLSCIRFPSIPESRYLVVPHSTGTVGGGVYDLGLVGLTADRPQSLLPGPVRRSPTLLSPPPERAPDSPPDQQLLWDSKLREMEARLVGEGKGSVGGTGGTRPSQAIAAPERAPQIGDQREFKVLNSESEFDRVTARIQFISEHTLVYLDEDAPTGGGYTSTDLARLAGQFEAPIHPTLTEAFGPESDLDGNGRVVILLTPAVNRLTPEGSDSYVGGFFFGLDLLEGRSGSNGGEIFYAAVPDPTGLHGPILPRSTLLYAIPAVLAHEFGHMVHFNQRILVAGAEAQEALWLSEALAQMAEDLVGSAYESMGDPAQARLFQTGNWSRARRFLLDPNRVSVLATVPPGTLEERGAAWLLLKFLHGHDQTGTILRNLVGSTATGTGNITRVVGRSWEELITEWAGAIYLDGLFVPVRTDLRFLGVNLRYVLSLIDGEFPLVPPELGQLSFSVEETLWSSAPDYYILTIPETGGLALNVSGPEGRPPEPASGLRFLVVRLK
ncbi:MAG: IPT/TIG domain-containing protein [Longimicrobiales bacterium]